MKKKESMAWFACYPEKWLNALVGMKPDVALSYFVICLRIYERRSAVPDSIESLARRVGFRPSHMRRIVDELIENGKLFRTDDGLMNAFAATEIAKSGTLRKDRVAGGEKISEKTAIDSMPEVLQYNNNSKDSKEESLLSCHDDSASQTQCVDATAQAAEKAPRRAPRRVMAQDWTPTEAGIQYATDRNLAPARIQQMIVACRDYHLSRGTLIADVAATWRTWVNNEVKWAKERNGVNGHGTLTAGDRARRFAEQARRLEDSAGVIRPFDSFRSH